MSLETATLQQLDQNTPRSEQNSNNVVDDLTRQNLENLDRALLAEKLSLSLKEEQVLLKEQIRVLVSEAKQSIAGVADAKESTEPARNDFSVAVNELEAQISVLKAEKVNDQQEILKLKTHVDEKDIARKDLQHQLQETLAGLQSEFGVLLGKYEAVKQQSSSRASTITALQETIKGSSIDLLQIGHLEALLAEMTDKAALLAKKFGEGNNEKQIAFERISQLELKLTTLRERVKSTTAEFDVGKGRLKGVEKTLREMQVVVLQKRTDLKGILVAPA